MAKRLDLLMTAYSSMNQYSGTVALAHEGKVVYQKSFGLADQEKSKPNTNNSLYNIGSIGKMFTSVAILQLVGQGKLKLDAPISQYLPSSNLPNADKITPVHLLTHSSGYGTYMRSKLYENAKVHTLDELIKIIAAQPLVFDKPSAGSAYSNSAFIILGRLIETASGMNWWEYFQKNIFAPAGMQSVHRYIPGEAADGKSLGYSYSASGRYVNVTNDPMPYPDGGFYATAQDLIKFIIAVQSGKLITKDMLQVMTKKYSRFDAYGWDMGLGWEMIKSGSVDLITKGGNVEGFSGEMVILPKGYTLILLSNLSTGVFDNFDDIIQGMYGLKKVEPKIAVTNYIYQQIKAIGWENIKPLMKEMVEKAGYTYNFRDYVRVAISLFDDKEYILTTSILEEIMKTNPKYIRGYDLLGQAYEAMDQKQKAIENYKMVLSLDASNDAVATKLKQLL